MVKSALGVEIKVNGSWDESLYWDLLEKVREYNTCDTLSSPIRVYLSEDHWVTVYEDIEKEVA
jgi:hypothetical protein